MNQLIKQNDTEHRLEIQRDFKRLSDEMCVVVESFVIWKTLVFSRSALINSEQQAEKNVNTINIYKDFFSATEHAHMHMFIVGICKFFDHDTRSLTIKSLMKKIKSNLDIDAEGTLQIDVKFIQELINRNERLIDELDRIRCKQFAHIDMVIMEADFVPNEISSLILVIQEILNKLSFLLDRSTTVWDHLEKNAKNDTDFLLHNLEKCEALRRAKINEKRSS